jgi:hypothetical protein
MQAELVSQTGQTHSPFSGAISFQPLRHSWIASTAKGLGRDVQDALLLQELLGRCLPVSLPVDLPNIEIDVDARQPIAQFL